MKHFVMVGGGTGGHVMPAIAVARELRGRGHSVSFIGTERGIESKLVPQEGLPIDFVRIGGLNRVGIMKRIESLCELPLSVVSAARSLGKHHATAVFSMGGYVAGPGIAAAVLKHLPIVVMEPNAIPGFTHRLCGRFVAKALVAFPETTKWFPDGRSDVSGVPVRSGFFGMPPKPRGTEFTVLIIGGSQGSRTLNRAVVESLPLWKGEPVRLVLQTGRSGYDDAARAFREAGVKGEVSPFLDDIAGAFAKADVIVSRAGMGALSEIAAAAKPSILVPFPGAADDHQLHNARAFEAAGAAALVLDAEMNGERFHREVAALMGSVAKTNVMSAAASSLAKPDAARRAADALEAVAK